jgi:hypothetical protein
MFPFRMENSPENGKRTISWKRSLNVFSAFINNKFCKHTLAANCQFSFKIKNNPIFSIYSFFSLSNPLHILRKTNILFFLSIKIQILSKIIYLTKSSNKKSKFIWCWSSWNGNLKWNFLWLKQSSKAKLRPENC